nr:hypothetical protein [Brevibacterium yomogidense]
MEVEEAIATHPGVADVAVVGKPDPEWGEQVVAFVTPADGAEGEALTTEGLQEFVGTKLARYKVPRTVVLEEALPRNPSGKLLKHKLREVAAGE